MKGMIVALMMGVVFAGLISCSQAGKKEDIMTSVQLYHANIRFARYRSASKYLVQAEKNRFMGRVEEIGDDLKITDFEIKDIIYNEDGTIDVEVEFTWYKLPSATVQKTRQIETWASKEEGWLIVNRTDRKGEEIMHLP